MRCFIAALLCVYPVLLLAGCGGSTKKEEAPKAIVKGIVNLDGKAMPTGAILFSIPGQPGRVLEITNGSFSGEALEGKNKVEVQMMKDDPKATTSPAPKINVLPHRYHASSTLTADVSKDGPNDFKFSITSK